jgi:hypothetical protein
MPNSNGTCNYLSIASIISGTSSDVPQERISSRRNHISVLEWLLTPLFMNGICMGEISDFRWLKEFVKSTV